MYDIYKEQMKAEGHEIHEGSGGFSGSGFKYDNAEDEAEVNKRKMTKLVHGMETAQDDDDEDIDQQLASMMKSQKRVVQGKAFGRKADTATETKISAARAAAEKIEAAKQLNVKAPLEKDATSLTAEAIMRGQDATPIQLTAASIAKQKAVELNERLNYLPSQLTLGDDLEQQAQYFEEELEINDFPHNSDTEFAPGTVLRKCKNSLMDEISLRRAKEEIVRIMREALRQMTATGSRPQYGGRYKVF
uniref:Uncharacterized protein n=1 Tax=Ditylenchus dipsaci TaxID=166011 RepID=A0A915DKU4_9BILA